jgi:hypothetical protein
MTRSWLRVLAAAPLCVFLGAGSALAQAVKVVRDTPSPYYARLYVGLAYQALGDWNDDIKEDESILQSGGVPMSLERLGSGFPIGFEAGYAISEDASIGIGAHYQRASSGNQYSDASGSVEASTKLSLIGVLAHGSYSLRKEDDIFLIGELGVGLGKAESNLALRDFATPANNLDVHGRWDGIGPIVGVAVAFERDLNPRTVLFSRVGYRRQNLGQLDGESSSPQLGLQVTGPPRNNAGDPMDTDFSGLCVLIGLGLKIEMP